MSRVCVASPHPIWRVSLQGQASADPRRPRQQATMTTLGEERTALCSPFRRRPCPAGGGRAGGAHPATTIAAVKVFFHLDIEIQGAVVHPPKVKVRKVDMLDGVTILWSEKVKDEIVLDGNDIELVSCSAVLIN